MQFSDTHQEMTNALEAGLFTGAVILVARADRILCQRAYGTLGGTGTAPVTEETLFDLASLTKVLATTPCWMVLASERPEILDEVLPRWFPQSPEDKREISPRHLLAHRSGLPAWRPYYLYSVPSGARPTFTMEKILTEPLHFSPGQGCLYSDLGFMTLAFIVEAETGTKMERVSRERIFGPLGLTEDLMFRPAGEETRTARTRGNEPPGLANDLNARALGGVAGHAGLFGTAKGVAKMAAEILASLTSARGFFDQ
ncbi:MAG: serine hydrolase, partial [Deltaproteobacteria bacterium]